MAELLSAIGGEALIVGPIIVVPFKRKVFMDVGVTGEELISDLKLTNKECMVFLCLASRAGAMVSKREMREFVWGDAEHTQSIQLIPVLINKIRKKMERVREGSSRHLTSVPRVGSMLSTTR